jgi:hypothetical protein
VNAAIHDATSGTAAKVNTLGQLTTSVSGSVNANPSTIAIQVLGRSRPGSAWTRVVGFAGGQIGAYHVTSIHVDTWSVAPGGNDAIQFETASFGNCANADGITLLDAVNPGGIGATTLTFGGGAVTDFPISSGLDLCVRNTDPANLGAEVFVYGYFR